MPEATLRSVGGSIVLSIPKTLLELVDLTSGDRVDVAIEAGKIVVSSGIKNKYKLEDLLRQCRSPSHFTNGNNYRL